MIVHKGRLLKKSDDLEIENWSLSRQCANDIALIHKIKHISMLHHDAAELGWATVTKENLIFLANISNRLVLKQAGNCCISYPIFTILADMIALIYIAAKRILAAANRLWNILLISERRPSAFCTRKVRFNISSSFNQICTDLRIGSHTLVLCLLTKNSEISW